MHKFSVMNPQEKYQTAYLSVLGVTALTHENTSFLYWNLLSHVCLWMLWSRVEAHITDDLRDYASTLEKHMVVYIFSTWEDSNQADCKLFGNFVTWLEFTMNLWNQKLAQSILPMSRVYYNRSFKPLIPSYFSTRDRRHVSWHHGFRPDRNWLWGLLKLNPNLIKIEVPYRLPMGSW